MREPRLQRPEPPPWQVPVARDDIEETGQHFALAANAEERAAVARMAGLRDLPRLEAAFEVTRQGAGLHVSGRVSATVAQNCVVTLEPLVNEIEEQVELLFMPPPPLEDVSDVVRTEEPAEAKWDEPEPLIGGVVDLGAIATEFLILGLDPYPRKPGAIFEPPREREPDESPFAALAGWARHRNDS
jgi:uncharacterized metal-binding protein YceD (DUF177 family)